MGRILSLVVIVVLLGAAGLFYASPMIAFYDVRSAAKSEDVESLAKLIGFDAVRASLKTQIEAGDAGVSAPPPSALNDPIGATGNVLKKTADSIGKAWNDITNPKAAPKTPPVPVVTPDDYLKPRALLALTYGAGKDSVTVDPDTFAPKPPAPKIAFFSLEHARLTVKDETRGTTTFTFTRKGLTHWEITHIGLPKAGEIEAEKAAAAASSSAAAASAQ